MASRFNRFTRKYENYPIPSEWHVTAYVPDLNTIVNCPHCGEPFQAKDGYTSMEIYTDNGIWGMIVHEKCYRQELDRCEEAEGIGYE